VISKGLELELIAERRLDGPSIVRQQIELFGLHAVEPFEISAVVQSSRVPPSRIVVLMSASTPVPSVITQRVVSPGKQVRPGAGGQDPSEARLDQRGGLVGVDVAEALGRLETGQALAQIGQWDRLRQSLDFGENDADRLAHTFEVGAELAPGQAER
jgi:hypothetical protein